MKNQDKEKFREVKLIEDASKDLKIQLSSNTLYVGPVDIQEVEWWEGRLIEMDTPYLLVQAETTIGTPSKPVVINGKKKRLEHPTDPMRFAKGYFLFTYNTTMLRVYAPASSNNPNPSVIIEGTKLSTGKQEAIMEAERLCKKEGGFPHLVSFEIPDYYTKKLKKEGTYKVVREFEPRRLIEQLAVG